MPNNIELVYIEIKTLREARGITQAAMAEKLGVAHNNYGKIERGEIKLSVERLKEIIDIFNISMIQFFRAIELKVDPATIDTEKMLKLNLELQKENGLLKDQLLDKKMIIEFLQRTETTKLREPNETRQKPSKRAEK